VKVNKFVVGVDLGGTWIRVAYFNVNEKTLLKAKEPIDVRNRLAVSEQIIRMIRNLGQKCCVSPDSIEGVGIASAGPLDLKRGVLFKPTNLPFEQVPLVEPIARNLDVPVTLTNDCAAAVLGEKTFGKGKDVDNLFYLALGTGIGGGAMVDGHLLIGKDGNAAEIGHFTIDYEGKLMCGCGRRGHWEAYCSGRNIPNFIDMRMKEIDPTNFKNSSIIRKDGKEIFKLTSETFFNAAKNKDPLSLILVEEIGLLNAIGIANIINAYDPSLISIGGAIALNNVELILTPILKNFGDYTINRKPEIIVSSLGEDTGLLGGISAILNQSNKQL
jgi:glucokinase